MEVYKNKKIKIWKKIAEGLIYLLVIFFIFRLFSNYWPQIREQIVNIKIFNLFISIFLYGFGLLILSYSSYRIILNFGRINFIQSSYCYFKSQITRYIPGNIWGVAARLYFFRKYGFKKREILAAFFYESGLIIFSAALAYFIFRGFYSSYLFLDIILAVVGFLVFLIIFNCRIFSYFFSFFKKTEIEIKIPLSKSISYIFLYLIFWLFCGLALYFLLNSFADYKISIVFPLLSIYAAAWALGYLSFITPTGLGVREMTLIYLLTKIIAKSSAGLLTIFARLVFILSEIIVFSFISLVYLFKNKKNLITTNQK